MKILIDARMYGLEHTGIGRYLVNLVKHLSLEDKDNQYVILLRSKYFNSLKLPENWEKREVDVHHYTVREQLLLPVILYQENPDVVHFPQLNIPLLYFGKYVVTVHDLTQLDYNAKATTLPWPLYLIKFVAINLAYQKVKFAKTIITPTQIVKQNVVASGVNTLKVKVLYEGLDLDVAQQTPLAKLKKKYGLKNKYFMYVGNAYPHKNVETAILATKSLNDHIKEKIDFIIVSARNNFTQKLSQFAKKHAAQDMVHQVGFVPDEDLAGLLSHAQAFIYPSTREGFGLPGLEAIAAGTDLIVSDIPVFREVYEGHATYFDYTSVTDLTKKMKATLDEKKAVRAKKVKAAQKFVKRYSWGKMAQDTLSIYKAAFDR